MFEMIECVANWRLEHLLKQFALSEAKGKVEVCCLVAATLALCRVLLLGISRHHSHCLFRRCTPRLFSCDRTVALGLSA